MFLLSELKELPGEIYYYVGCTAPLLSKIISITFVMFYKLKN